MKFKNITYVILMIFFMAISYLLINSGLNTKTKIVANYKENSDLTYKVYLHENDVYQDEYLDMNQKYVADLVDYLDISFNYKDVFDKDVNGYYSYVVMGELVAYEEEGKESLFKKEYTLMELKATVLDANNTREININDTLAVDYDTYRDELLKFKKDYNIDVYGYMDIKIIIKLNLEFKGIERVVEDVKVMTINVPLGDDTFRIVRDNENNKKDSYYDFSKNERVNYLLILIGMFSLSIGISFLALTIRNMIIANRIGHSYQKELDRILTEYDDIIVTVKRFYSRKKYNLIYVESFKELMDAYNKVGNPITFRETKKGEEATFLMTQDENAWIYKLKNK